MSSGPQPLSRLKPFSHWEPNVGAQRLRWGNQSGYTGNLEEVVAGLASER
jgi:hypothetical protein